MKIVVNIPSEWFDFFVWYGDLVADQLLVNQKVLICVPGNLKVLVITQGGEMSGCM